MKTNILLILSLMFSLSMNSYSDKIGYNKIVEIREESINLIVIHYHNWTAATRESRFKMITTHKNPFNEDNDYAYLICINKNNKDTIFKRPSPALTIIKISDDEKYILGLSKIKLWNPVQFVLFTTTGTLFDSRLISSQEAKLSQKEYDMFKNRYSKQNKLLESKNRIYKTNENYYIDFLDENELLGKAWNYLFKYLNHNHLSPNFSESVTNWIFWYNEDNPDIKFQYKNDMLVGISLLDPKKNRIEIKK